MDDGRCTHTWLLLLESFRTGIHVHQILGKKKTGSVLAPNLRTRNTVIFFFFRWGRRVRSERNGITSMFPSTGGWFIKTQQEGARVGYGFTTKTANDTAARTAWHQSTIKKKKDIYMCRKHSHGEGSPPPLTPQGSKSQRLSLLLAERKNQAPRR